MATSLCGGLRKIYTVTLTLTLVLALFAALGAAFLVSARLSAPLEVLAEGTEAVAKGDFAPRAEISSKDELGLLTQRYQQPLRVEDLAEEIHMSASSLHQHFKAVTAMSPLQFQKRLRLQEARRLMLGENLDAASTGYRVGYDNAADFNREYKPMRDVERLREAASNSPLQAVARGQ